MVLRIPAKTNPVISELDQCFRPDIKTNRSTRQSTTKKRSVEQFMELARKEERLNIGGVLHDSVNQLLAVSALYIGMIGQDTIRNAEYKQSALNYINDAVAEIRKLSHAMVRSGSAIPLFDIIRKLLADISVTTKLSVFTSLTWNCQHLTADRAEIIKRIIQEHLKNVIRHSKASALRFGLKRIGSFIYLVIRDNGVGFNPDQQSSGIGLSNMKRNASTLGGDLIIRTEPGKGCMVAIRFPACTC